MIHAIKICKISLCMLSSTLFKHLVEQTFLLLPRLLQLPWQLCNLIEMTAASAHAQ